ncbi:peptidylprolyl isomerase [Pseudochelatococcus contaminans]|uniref:Parvulin-like PPIase n=1 Tax=Pseudochelatococcus contaminans TaxID=1538103 RepID=A0A7W6EG61_9HYPH|nr:peptidylprolyl isomerase [Pseudochelatococcus contaminans]MBB3809238.1 peptidyl-prolyl cis-trans isomerase D [Pseudochelatococcus contaminans]
MLQLLRNSGRHWLGKTVTFVLFGLLILSFAIWGISGWFIYPVATQVAEIGDRTITVEEMREAYLARLQALQQQLRMPISTEQARAMGLDQQVLGQLVSQAVLDTIADDLRLAVPDETIVAVVTREPQFRDSAGNFNRAAFDSALRNAGITEQAFVAEQRAVLPRRQIAESIAGDIAPSRAMQAAFHRYGTERRTAQYATLAPAAAGPVADPDDAMLEAWFKERPELFRLPEFRSLSVLDIEPETLAKPEAVSREAALARYEAEKENRYGTPETRHVQQLVFPTQADADAAYRRLTDGGAETFESIAAERNVAETDYDLGLVARDAVFDPAVAEAAFALVEPGVSQPVQGRFGTVITRVVSITPPSVQSFGEVEQAVRLAIAIDEARAAVEALHDSIEEARAAMRPLSEIAEEKQLPLRTIPAIDRAGQDRDGAPITDLPEAAALITAAFASDVGADNAPLRQQTSTGTGYIWYDVTDVSPERDRTFEEARADALTRWREEAAADKLTAVVGELAARLDGGESFETVIASLPQEAVVSPLTTASGIARSGETAGLPPAVVQQVFATHKGKAGSAAVSAGRVLFQVTEVTTPPLDIAEPRTAAVTEQLSSVIADDLLTQYIGKRQAELKPTVNPEALRAATGLDTAGL